MINLEQKILGISLKYWILLSIILVCGCYSIRENMTNNKKKIILYWADWCGYSNQFKPIWDDFKKQYTKNDYQIIDINCGKENNQKECRKHNDIEGFPTVIKQSGSRRDIYQGPRSIEGLNKFL